LGKFAAITAFAATAALAAPGAATAQVASANGGAAASPAPVLTDVGCQASCRGLQRATAGATVRVTGRGLKGATAIVFLGKKGPRDDVYQRVTASTDTTADAIVPAKARTGPVRVLGPDGQPSKATSRRILLGRDATRNAPLLQARISSRRVFLDGASLPTLTFFVGGGAPSEVRVDLLRDGEPQPVATWTPGPLAPGSVNTIVWDGPAGPVRPPEGRYRFRITALGGALARASSQSESAPTTAVDFFLVGHAFPIQGTYKIGTSSQQVFGAGRGGRRHQGHDIFAKCGTPLVAATSGVIKRRAYQSAAGHYIVLAADGGEADYAYMHLREPALVKAGERVKTGQLVGYVGDTGRASGCHLHFEKWTAPGWYSGGSPVDPLPDLRAWARAG